MTKYSWLIILMAAFTACINHEKDNGDINIELEQLKEERVEIQYAEGFEIEYEDTYIKVVTKSFQENTFFKDSVYIPQSSNLDLIPDGVKVLNNEVKTISCQSVTHLAFIEKLDKINAVSGVCGLKYVNDPLVKGMLTDNGAQEICLEDGMLEETILNLNPELLLLYPFGADYGNRYTEKGVATILIAEYLEKSQLARLEWIKLFGVLFNKVAEANAYFDKTSQQYIESRKANNGGDKKTFIMNLPFKESWFMPSSNSVGVELIEDAGLSYYYEEDQGTENNLRSTEVVWEAGSLADYWVIVAQRPKGFSLDDLILEEPAYKTFKSVQNKNVIFCNTSETDYFSKGVVEPNIVLNDLLFARGELSSYQPTYFFRLE